MSVVLDASIAAKWFLSDERKPNVDAILDRVSEAGAYAPTIFRWEIGNVLLTAERAGRLNEDDVDNAFELLRDLPILLETAGERVFAGNDLRLARHYGLTAYDAAYLAVAASRRLPLATDDGKLIHAARDLGIPVLP